MDDVKCPYCYCPFESYVWDESSDNFTEECPECKKKFYVKVKTDIFYKFHSFQSDRLNKEKKNNEPTLFDID